METTRSAHKHDILYEDIKHAVEHAMAIEDHGDERLLYLGPARNAALLELIKVAREDSSGHVIHAMPMRSKYQHLLPDGRAWSGRRPR
jgi:hypothetical protein